MELKSYCCETLRDHTTSTCSKHPNREDCPDALIMNFTETKGAHRGAFGIMIHDGGSSAVIINFCPWCGTDIRPQVDRRQENRKRFDCSCVKLNEALGIYDMKDQARSGRVGLEMGFVRESLSAQGNCPECVGTGELKRNPKNPRVCRYVDGFWHVPHDDGTQGFCGKGTKGASEEIRVPTCAECCRLIRIYS